MPLEKDQTTAAPAHPLHTLQKTPAACLFVELGNHFLFRVTQYSPKSKKKG